jgi:hypothetical protein
MNRPNKIECYITSGRKGLQGQRLIGPIGKLQRKRSVVNTAPGALFRTLHFLRNLQIGPIS